MGGGTFVRCRASAIVDQMAFKALGNALSKLGVKAPWQITGPASHVEYKDAIVKVGSAAAVRKGTPASQPHKVQIPHTEDHNIFNTRYYDRKERLAAAMGKAPPKHTPRPADPSTFPPITDAVFPDPEAFPKPPTLGTPFRKWGPGFGERVPLMDYKN